MTDAEFAKLTDLKLKETRFFKVRFLRHLSAVNTDMQPKIQKEYILKAVGTLNTEPMYIITLENGLPLIVYREEFEVLSPA